MYTHTNYPTKKALKEAVASGERVTVYQPNGRGGTSWYSPQTDGSCSLEGPHYPKAHSWYAACEIAGGVIVPGTIQ